MAQQIMVPGAASVAIKCKDGVVLGSDRRATWGYTVINKATRKVFKITEQIGLASYGLIGDAQILIRILRAQANLYLLDAGEPISTRSMGKMVSNYLYSRKMAPLLSIPIIAGMDKEGPQLYTLDQIGSLMPEDYGAVGSGMLLSYGILEAEYKPGMTVAAGEKLVEKTIQNTIARDVMSGNGIDILSFTKTGAKESYIEIKELGE
ncbi:MAG: proteasome subunit beta [Promethearchaeota archaeon]|jgi:proteasome beta subunit